MKRILVLTIILLLPFLTYAQAPQAFGYQAIVVNADNTVAANQTVGLRISLLNNSSDTTVLYSETHTPTTNASGLFSIEIGRGVPSSSKSLDSINWANGSYYLKSEIDPDGGNNYTIVSIMQLLSVPYALYANSASTLVGFSDSLHNLRTQYHTAVENLRRHYDSIIAAMTEAADSTIIVIDDNDTTSDIPQHSFSVANGHFVYFSPGNLQYQASTSTWRFAPHQYDIAGDDNTHISSTFNGWIDLFGWGTSGWPSGANVYKPFATSNTHSDYFVGGAAANNLSGNYANADWGIYNSISYGSNTYSNWRTPTADEWLYLISQRRASTISGVSNARFVRAIVGELHGLILFPDHYSYPIGIDPPEGSYINNLEASPFSTTYTVHEWAALEADGAVFLPVGGYRDETRLLTNPPTGYYWSSSHHTPQWSYTLMFNANTVAPQNDTPRQRGCYVRLIQDIIHE